MKNIEKQTLYTRMVYRIYGRKGLFHFWFLFQRVVFGRFKGMSRMRARRYFRANPGLPTFSEGAARVSAILST